VEACFYFDKLQSKEASSDITPTSLSAAAVEMGASSSAAATCKQKRERE
jgi:hypothetical protein